MDATPPGQIVVARADVRRIPRPNAIAGRATRKGLKATRLSSPPLLSIKESQAACARFHEQRQMPRMPEDGTAAGSGAAPPPPRRRKGCRRPAPETAELIAGRPEDPERFGAVGNGFKSGVWDRHRPHLPTVSNGLRGAPETDAGAGGAGWIELALGRQRRAVACVLEIRHGAQHGLRSGCHSCSLGFVSVERHEGRAHKNREESAGGFQRLVLLLPAEIAGVKRTTLSSAQLQFLLESEDVIRTNFARVDGKLSSRIGAALLPLTTGLPQWVPSSESVMSHARM